MSGRIVLFGATGYTGRLTAAAMVQRGLQPVLAGRHQESLEQLVDELGGAHTLDIEIADVSIPESVRDLVEPGDVLVTTVGPFAQFGLPALEACIGQGATYIDSTGEPSFLRQVFEDFGPKAAAADVTLLPACGYDYVPGNLAGALALEKAEATGTKVTRLDVLYATRGQMKASGGTMASAAAMLSERSPAYRGGRIIDERPGVRTWVTAYDERDWQGLSVGGTEHWTMPRLNDDLLDVSVYLGWLAGRTEQAAKAAAVADHLWQLPGTKKVWGTLTKTFVRGSSGGPDAETRAQARSLAIAETRTLRGERVSHVVVEGPSPYDLTAELLAWAAEQAQAGGLQRTGSVGVIDGFGRDRAVSGLAALGLTEVSEE